MKNILKFAFALITAFALINPVQAQDSEKKVYTPEEVQSIPEFPGGRDSLNSFLRENIQYPRRSIMNGEKGRVYISCVIDLKGTVTNAEVSHTEKLSRGSVTGKIESTGVKIKRPLLEAEALRVVNSFPKFSPGKNKNGEVVEVRILFPITFWVGGL